MKLLLAASLAVVTLALMPSVVSAGGFTMDKLNDQWLCEADAGLPPGHCLNPGTGHRTVADRGPEGDRGPGQTFLIMVFEPAGDQHFESAEGATTLDADDRPCPHDDDPAAQGTWWEPLPGLFVCHHQ